MWIGVKGQSNSEIAGTPRNSFRASLIVNCMGGRALNELGPFTGYQTQPNSEYLYIIYGSQTVGDKIHSQKGNSPDRRLRSPIHAKWKRKCNCKDSQEVGLEAAIP